MENLMVVIYPSDDCNRECQYCYHPVTTTKMSLRVAEDVSNWIENICEEEKVKNLNINFLGGEPTNNIEAVYRILASLEPLQKRLKVPRNPHALDYEGVSFRVFTNGDLLTEEILRIFKNHHAMIRLNPTYDSLEEVERKITFIKGICGGVDLAIALNDINLPRLEEITRLAIKYHCHMRPNQLYNGALIPGYIEEYVRQMRKMFKLLLEAEWVMYPNWIVQSTYPTWMGPKNPYSCGKWWIVIDSDGTLRSCNPDIGSKIGSIYTHKHWSDLKFLQRWSAKNLPECQGCEWITICQGGCPYIRQLTFGDYNHKSPYCGAFKILFPKLMELTKKWEEKWGLIGVK